MRIATRILTLVTSAALTLTTVPAHADRSSLPSVPSGERPGPALLYAKAPRAPQLENTGPWRADPILVSGAASYRSGEWVYQDYLLDDHGARGVLDPRSPYNNEVHTYSSPFGTFTYPTDDVYHHNAADLVELRVRPLPRETAFRVTLNSLEDPARTAFTVALGSSPTRVAWPYGAGVSSPAAMFLTWHGDTVQLTDALGREMTPAPTVKVDLLRRQVEVRVPHAAWDPGRSTVRTTVGVGLWDPASHAYLKPSLAPATATTPGGGTPQGVAIVNVGPRLAEPQPTIAGLTLVDAAVGSAVIAPWWREQQQGTQLTLGDVTPFAADVDFGKLQDRLRDDSHVPTSGSINRILASSEVHGQGVDPDTVCVSLSGGLSGGGAAQIAAPTSCTGRFPGQLQAYTVYVPERPAPRRGWGMTLLMHSLSANYNQYSASSNQSQLGERGRGSLVVTPGGRGPDGFYRGAAEADVFETWADVARHYPLDPRWSAASGYSMGGFGTYRLLARWPDLFGRGFAVVGLPGTVIDQLASLRNNQLMSWLGAADELVPLPDQRDALDALTDAGVRFEHRTFATADHLTLATNDEYGDGADYLGTHRARRDPRHVTYVVDRTEDTPLGALRADHAWWLSGIRASDTERAGTIDVRSLAARRGTAAARPLERGAGVLQGGQNQAMAYVSESVGWDRAPRTRRRDALRIVATNVRRVVVDPRRAGVTCDAALRVVTDGRLVVVLRGCGRRVFR